MNRWPCGWWILPASLLGLLMWIGIISVAFAENVSITWIIATERTDGTALPITEISHHRVFVNEVWNFDVYPNTEKTVTLDLPAGDKHIKLTTVDTYGRESIPSEEKFVPGGAPNAPGQILIIVLP